MVDLLHLSGSRSFILNRFLFYFIILENIDLFFRMSIEYLAFYLAEACMHSQRM